MENSQLHEILKSFTKNDFKELGKFVSSPFFNNRDEVTRFYNALKKFYPYTGSAKFTKENLFKQVYPKKKYSDVLMRKLLSLMLNLTLEFLLVQNVRSSALESDVRLLEILRQRKLLGIFERKQKKITEILQCSKHDFNIYELQYKATSSINGLMLLKDEKEMLRVFQKEHDEFVAYFLGYVLLQYIRFSEWSKMYNLNFNMRLLGEVSEYLERNKFSDYPLITLYYNMMMLIRTGENKYYNELYTERIKYLDKVTGIHSYNIALVMIQHCYKMIQSGNYAYKLQQFELTNSIIDNDLIPEGFIELYFFTNTIRLSAGLKEFDWTENFIEKFKYRLDPDFKDEILEYSRSLLDFNKRNFESSLKHLSSINVERANMKYDIKIVQAMNLFELGYTEQLLQHIDAFKHYISRDVSMSAEFKDKFKKFLNITIQLSKLRDGDDPENTEYLYKEIKNSSYFSYKDWVLEKLTDLLNKKAES